MKTAVDRAITELMEIWWAVPDGPPADPALEKWLDEVSRALARLVVAQNAEKASDVREPPPYIPPPRRPGGTSWL
jgi:hypothetical protein